MRANTSTNLNNIRKNYIDMAKDFCYNEDIIEKLKTAKTEIEMENIMIGARKR